MTDLVEEYKLKIEQQKKTIKTYEAHCKKLQSEIDRLKEELVKYRGY